MKTLRRLWCRLTHRSIMLPGGPTYECRRCGERWEVSWLDGPAPRFPKSQETQQRVPTEQKAEA